MSKINKGFQYRPRYGVIVICKSENEQKQVYEQLKSLKLKIRVVCV